MATLEELAEQSADEAASMFDGVFAQNSANSIDGDPKQAQRALELSRQSGVAPAIIELDPDSAARQFRMQQNAALLSADPELQKFALKNPTAAKATHDEYEKLSVFGKAFYPIKTGWNRGLLGESLGVAGAKLATGLGSEEEAAALEKRLEAEPELHGLAGGVQMVSEMAGSLLFDLAMGSPMAGAGALAGPIGAGLGAIAGMSSVAGTAAAGRQYLQLRKARDEQGNALSEPVLLGASVLTGIGTAALNMVGVRGATNQIAGTIVEEGITRALRDQGFRQVALEAGKAVASTSTIFAGMAGTQVMMEGVIADMAKEITPGEWKTIANDPKKREELIERVNKAMIQGAALGATFHGPIATYSVGRSMLHDAARARAAERDLAAYDKLIDSADAVTSKEGLAAFMESVGGADQIVAVPLEQLRPLFEADPARFARFGDLSRQIAEADMTGGDVHLSLGQLMLDPELARQIREDVRMRPDSLTQREAKELTDNPPEYPPVEAWHGSPHIFDAFSMEHIGKGEGAQVYGHGLYFAENRGVAKSYQDNLTDTSDQFIIEGRKFDPDTRPDDYARQVFDASGDKETALAEIRELMEEWKGTPSFAEDVEFFRKAIEWLEKQDPDKFPKITKAPPKEGALYQVRLNVRPDRTVLYDRPLAEQPPAVMEFFRKEGWRDDLGGPKSEGFDLLTWLEQKLMNEVELKGERSLEDAARVEASKRMQKAGIQAIKYADAVSRGDNFEYTVDGRPINLDNPQEALGRVVSEHGGKEKALDILEETRDEDYRRAKESGEEADKLEAMTPEEFKKETAGLSPESITQREAISHHREWEREYLERAQETDKFIQQIKEDNFAKVEKTPRKQTFNYVVLDDTLIEITHRNGEPVLKQKVVEAVQKERAAAWLDPLFRPEGDKATPLGMTAPEYAAYSKKLEQLQAAIERKAEAVAEREIAKRLTPEWERNLKEITDETRIDLSYRPDNLLDSYLRTSTLPNGRKGPKLRLDRAAVEAILGDKGELPKGFTADKNGLHPDDVAAQFGFGSGQQMLLDLSSLHRKRQLEGAGPKEFFEMTVKEEANARMEARHGKLDEVIAREAQETVVERAQTEVLAAELEFLSREGDTPITRADIESNVAESFATIPVERARDYEGFMRLVAKAGRAAELALLKGKTGDAFIAKQRQYAALLMAQNAKAFQRDFNRFSKTMVRFRERIIPSVAQEYTDRVHEIMTILGIPHKRNPAELADAVSAKTLDQFADAVKDRGREMPMVDFSDPIFFKDGDPAQGRLPFGQLPAQAFHWVKDTIDTMVANGRQEKKLKLADEMLDFEEAKDQALASLATRDTVKAPINPEGLNHAKLVARKFDASLLKIEQLVQDLDRHDPTGVFTKLFQNLTEAKHAVHRGTQKLGELLSKVPGDAKFKRSLENALENTELRDWKDGDLLKLNGHDLLGFMLHMGNESNFAKLTSKFKWMGNDVGFDAAALQRFVDRHATKTHWDVVQHLWDINENHFWPQVRDLYRRVSGIAPDKIEGREFKRTFDGVEYTYRGGYVPIDKDPRWPHMGEGGKGIFAENRGVSALPPKGYTMTRTEMQYPISYTFQSAINGMRETLHDLHYREPLIEAKKFFEDRQIKEGIIQKYGEEYYNEIKPWLEYIAHARRVDEGFVQGWDKFFRGLRNRIVVTELVGRGITVFKHGAAALSNSLGEIGRLLGHGKGELEFLMEFVELFGTPHGWRMAMEAQKRSGELTTRMHQWDRDLRAMSERVVLGTSSLNDRIAFVVGKPFAWLDQASAIPVYLIAERHYLSQGFTQAEASRMADTVVRNAHGASGITDLAPILRSGEGTRLLTVAYGTFNHSYNRLRMIAGELREGGKDLANLHPAEAFGHFYRATMLSAWYIFLLAALEHWITHEGPDENKEESMGLWLGKGIASQVVGTVPAVRDIGMSLLFAAEGKQFPGGGPLGSVADTSANILRTMMGATSKGELDGAWWQHFMRGAGYATGVPGMGQVAVTGQFLIDLDRGHQDADTNWRMMRGLITGKADPHEKVIRR